MKQYYYKRNSFIFSFHLGVKYCWVDKIIGATSFFCTFRTLMILHLNIILEYPSLMFYPMFPKTLRRIRKCPVHFI